MKPRRMERLTIKHLHHELMQLKQEVKKQGENIMSAIENLTQAIAGLNTTVIAVSAKIDALKTVPNNDAVIQSAADSVTAATNTLNQVIQ